MKESKHPTALCSRDGGVSANQLIVIEETLRKSHGTEGFYSHLTSHWQSSSKHYRVEIVPLSADILTDRPIIERTGKGGDKVNLPSTSPLQKAAPGDFDGHFNAWGVAPLVIVAGIHLRESILHGAPPQIVWRKR